MVSKSEMDWQNDFKINMLIGKQIYARNIYPIEIRAGQWT